MCAPNAENDAFIHVYMHTYTLTLRKKGKKLKEKECGQSLLFRIGLADKEAMRRIRRLAGGYRAKDQQRRDPAGPTTTEMLSCYQL